MIVCDISCYGGKYLCFGGLNSHPYSSCDFFERDRNEHRCVYEDKQNYCTNKKAQLICEMLR